MAKYYGPIGFKSTYEDPESPGDWVSEIVEKKYYGDVISNRRNWQETDRLNDNLVIKNSISIVADEFAYRNLHEICYVVWLKTKWKVTDIEVKYPRLVLSIGGVYNDDEGPQA